MRIRQYFSGDGTSSGPGGSVDFTQPLILPLFLFSTTHLTDTEIASKGYVDQKRSSISATSLIGTLPAARLPAYTGLDVSSPGGGLFYLSPTGILTGEYTKYTVDSKGRVISAGQITLLDLPALNFGMLTGLPTLIAGYGVTDVLGLYSGQMTGYLTLGNAPSQPTHLANKEYVDNVFANHGQPVAYSTGDIITRVDPALPEGYLRANGGQVSKSLYPDLYLKIGDRFSVNTRAGAGRPWEQQYEFNTTPALPLAEPQVLHYSKYLPYSSQSEGVYRHQAVVTKNKLYLIGGLNNGGTASNKLASMTLYDDGTESTWELATLPFSLHNSASVVVNNTLYLIGGNDGTVKQDVRSVTIQADGTIDPNGFVYRGDLTLPVPLEGHQAFATKTRIYVLGGRNPASNTLFSVYYAPIDADGNVGAWVEDTGLPGPVSYFAIAVTKNRVYVLGGYNENNSTYRDNIYTASIQQDGSIGFWLESAVRMPTPVTGHTALVTGNVLRIFGGIGPGMSYFDKPRATAILPDGALAGWGSSTFGGYESTQTDSVMYSPAYGQVVATANGFYLLGGIIAGNNSYNVWKGTWTGGLNDYSPYYISRSHEQSGRLNGAGQPWKQLDHKPYQALSSTWITSESLPVPVYEPYVFVTHNRVYVMGGYSPATSESVNLVQISTINEDGSLGGWWTESWTLPDAYRSGEGVILPTMMGAYLLHIGGYRGDSMTTSDIYGIPFDPATDSEITSTTPYNFTYTPSLRDSAVVVTKKKLYVIGGTDNTSTPVSNMFSADLEVDGTFSSSAGPGEIMLDSALTVSGSPVTMTRVKAAQVGNYVYLLGGVKNGVYNSDVYRFTIAVDGSLRSLTKISGLALPFNDVKDVYVAGNVIHIFSATNISTIGRIVVSQNGDLAMMTSITTTGVSAGATQPFVFATSTRVYAYGNGWNHYLTGSVGENSYVDEYYRPATVEPFEATGNSQYFTLPDTTATDSAGVYSYIKT